MENRIEPREENWGRSCIGDYLTGDILGPLILAGLVSYLIFQLPNSCSDTSHKQVEQQNEAREYVPAIPKENAPVREYLGGNR